MKKVGEYHVGFQFLGIPPKGEPGEAVAHLLAPARFPISRDPPEGGTTTAFPCPVSCKTVSNF